MVFRDIRKSQRFLSAVDIGFVLGLIVLIAVLLVLNIHLSRTYKGGEWLFLRWSGARAFMLESFEPYGSTVAQRVQNLVYGRGAYLNEYPYVLNDPFYIILLYVPLALFADFTVAHGIWMFLSQAAVVGIILFSIRFAEWEPPPWVTLLVVGFGLFNAFSVHAFLSASPTALLTVIYLSILYALQSHADELAGASLFLVAYQWEVGALFFALILALVILNRRWGVLAGFLMTLLVLVTFSILVDSGWTINYFRAVLFDWRREADYTFGVTLSYVFPRLTVPPSLWITGAILVILFFETIRAVYAPFRHIAWLALLSLTLNPMVGFAIFPSDHIALLPAFVLVIALVWERWSRWRMLLSPLLLILVLGASHALFYQISISPARLYSDLLKILPPVLGTIGLYWMRWWAVRPPRLWADQLGVRK